LQKKNVDLKRKKLKMKKEEHVTRNKRKDLS